MNICNHVVEAFVSKFDQKTFSRKPNFKTVASETNFGCEFTELTDYFDLGPPPNYVVLKKRICQNGRSVPIRRRMSQTIALASETNKSKPYISGNMYLGICFFILMDHLIQDCMNEVEYLEFCRDSVLAEYWVIVPDCYDFLSIST